MSCPVVDHLACKLPGELEPRPYDVYFPLTIAAGTLLQNQSVDIGNRDAPWHLCAIGYKEISGTGRLFVKLYNSRGFAYSDDLLRAGNFGGGANALVPVNPSLVWPVNSSLVLDVQNAGVGSGTFHLYFYGFKVFDRGKAPC